MRGKKMTEHISDAAANLAINLERRGAIEGHYVWPAIIQQALDATAAEARREAIEQCAAFIETHVWNRNLVPPITKIKLRGKSAPRTIQSDFANAIRNLIDQPGKS